MLKVKKVHSKHNLMLDDFLTSTSTKITAHQTDMKYIYKFGPLIISRVLTLSFHPLVTIE